MELKKLVILLVIISVIAAGLLYFFGQSKKESIIALEPQVNEGGGVVFEVRPSDFSFDKPVKFEVKIDTHSGSLDFDLVRNSVLKDDAGNQYQPLEWQGAAGGHHLSGNLIFPTLSTGTKTIKLIIANAYGISERSFEWNL